MPPLSPQTAPDGGPGGHVSVLATESASGFTILAEHSRAAHGLLTDERGISGQGRLPSGVVHAAREIGAVVAACGVPAVRLVPFPDLDFHTPMAVRQCRQCRAIAAAGTG